RSETTESTHPYAKAAMQTTAPDGSRRNEARIAGGSLTFAPDAQVRADDGHRAPAGRCLRLSERPRQVAGVAVERDQRVRGRPSASRYSDPGAPDVPRPPRADRARGHALRAPDAFRREVPGRACAAAD